MKKDLLTFLFLVFALFATDFPHYGKVTDASNQPLAQVKVVSKATGKTTTTDSNGNFGSWPEAVLKTTVQDIAEPALFYNRLYLSATRAGEAISATLLNVRGQALWQFDGVSERTGLNTIPVDYTVATGMYLIRLSVGERVWCSRVTTHQKPKLISRQETDVTSATAESRLLPFDDTLIVSAKGYYRTTRTIPGGDNSAITLAMATSDAKPEVAFATDTLQVVAGAASELSVTATDLTGDIAKYYWRVGGVANIDSTIVPTYSYTAAEAGSSIVYCSVMNEYGTVSLSDSIVVVATEATITLSAPDTISINEDTPRELTIAEMDIVHAGSNKNYSFIITAGDSYTVEGATITPAVNYNGLLTVPVKVTNGEVTSNEEIIVVKVIAVTDAPLITGQNAISVNEDASVSLTAAMFTIVSADGDSEFTLTVADGSNYTVVNNVVSPVANFNGDLTVPVTVTAVGGTVVSAVYNAVITVTPVNDAPTIGAIPDGVVGIGNSYTTNPVSIADVDGDALTVILPATAVYNETSKKITYTSDITTDVIGENMVLLVKVTDGIDTATTTLSLTVVKHQWTMVTQMSDSIRDLAATEGHIYALCASDGTNQKLYDLSETGTTNQSLIVGTDANRDQGVKLKSVGEKLYLSKVGYNPSGPAPQYGFLLSPESFNLNDSVKRGVVTVAFFENNESNYTSVYTSRVWNGMNWNTMYMLYDSYKDTANNGFTPEGFGSFHDVVAARSGINAIVTQNSGAIFQKTSASGGWTKRDLGVILKTITFTSDNGYSFVAINDAGALYKKSSSSPYVTSLSTVSGAPTNLVSVVSKDENSLWALDEFGTVHFTSKGFEGGQHSTEQIDGKKITKVVLSNNKSDLYVVTEDSFIYKY